MQYVIVLIIFMKIYEVFSTDVAMTCTYVDMILSVSDSVLYSKLYTIIIIHNLCIYSISLYTYYICSTCYVSDPPF